LILFLSGFRLTKTGKPYQAFLLTIHKLISLGILIFIIINIFNTQKDGNLTATLLTSGIITGILFLLTIVSGGMVSFEKPMPVIFTKIHHTLPYLNLISSIITLFLLSR
jgi:hypothetical protein